MVGQENRMYRPIAEEATLEVASPAFRGADFLCAVERVCYVIRGSKCDANLSNESSASGKLLAAAAATALFQSEEPWHWSQSHVPLRTQ
ncbi:hypothetical protein E2320_015226 [Naja naja]|nr:hypothetical protein E2320_015226 [Naja naja]